MRKSIPSPLCRVSQLIIAGLVFLSTLVQADDVRPVYIQLTERNSAEVDVQWKVPITVPAYALPQPVMPNHCRPSVPVVRGQTGSAYTFHQTFNCPQGMSGKSVGVQYPGINPGLNTLIRITLLNAAQHSQILKPGETRWQIPEDESFLSVAQQYTKFGIEHILVGFDHLLFVACLLFIAGTPRRILVTITGFTLAHSLTLALAALDLVRVPVPPVEATIALSIAFLAHEIAVDNRSTWTWRYPLLVSCSFGLLHGFGFASVLTEIGLPQTELAAGLLFFNVGVEIGQILFIGVLLLLIAIIGKLAATDRESLLAHRKINLLSSYTIGIVASFWLVERVIGFFP